MKQNNVSTDVAYNPATMNITKLESAKIFGIILVILSLCVCLKGDDIYIITGISAAVIHSILVFGTFCRNSRGGH